jgi:tRNA dimethylallyltransferase
MSTYTSPLLVIVGPTASGKTDLAIFLAQKFNGEIICADSRTIYKYMDIGTAKPTKDEQSEAVHHLLDIVEPNERFSAAKFKELATKKIDVISKAGKLPILVGGSGMYIDSVIYDYKFSDSDSPKSKINPRHLSDSGLNKDKQLRPSTIVVGLSIDNENLKKKLNERVGKMVEAGLVDEISFVAGKYGWDAPALSAPAYKAFKEYIENKISLEEAKAKFERNDFLLAKRQRTWFKRNKSIHWTNNRDEIVELVTTSMNKKD